MKTIIEVGANSGTDTINLAADGSTVYAFEPTHELVKNNLWPLSKQYPNIKVVPFAVDTVNNFTTFNIAGQWDWGCSSLHPFSGQWEREDFHFTDFYQVPTITLYDFCNLYNINFIDYLWIDAQGNDFNCLLSLKDKINIVKEGRCEVALTKELYKDTNNNIKYVKPWLEQHGFAVEIYPDPIEAEANLKFYRL
jgi:FkbM family methyltransferase